MGDIGFITVARGDVGYVEMAVDLALSLREHHREPIAVLVDAAAEAHVRAHFPRVFDAVLRLPPGHDHGWACKFALAEATPFEHTVFVDADTLVLRDLDDVLAQARDADMLMMGKFRTAETTEVHHGFSIRGLISDFELERYFDNHSGAFVFRRAPGRRFLAECREVYDRDLYRPSRRMRGLVGDELAFGIVAGRRGVSIMREPYPVYWSNELAELRSDRRWKPLCHFHAAPGPEAMDWLMAEVSARRAAAGLPDTSVDYWRRKAGRGRFMAMTERWANRLYRGWRRLTGSGDLAGAP